MPRNRISTALLAAASWISGGTASGELEVGSAAPAFTLPGSDGASHSLEQYKNQKTVVLAWFPRAFTPG